jgi:hypothetical protein
MTLMWCAFDGNPWIVRTYGPATVVHAGEPEWDSLLGMFPPMLGARQVFRQQVDLVLTSCGFGVPRYSYEGDRDLMEVWARRKGEEGLATYRREKNSNPTSRGCTSRSGGMDRRPSSDEGPSVV